MLTKMELISQSRMARFKKYEEKEKMSVKAFDITPRLLAVTAFKRAVRKLLTIDRSCPRCIQIRPLFTDGGTHFHETEIIPKVIFTGRVKHLFHFFHSHKIYSCIPLPLWPLPRVLFSTYPCLAHLSAEETGVVRFSDDTPCLFDPV